MHGRSLPRNFLPMTASPNDKDGGAETRVFRNEYQVQWFDHEWKTGDECEYQIRPDRWIPCLIIGRRSDDPTRYAARYVSDIGHEKTGLVGKHDLRPLSARLQTQEERLDP